MENENDETNKNLKLIAKSSIIVFVGIFLSKLFTYLDRIIVAREFGPAEYGLFTLSIMITGWFIALSSVGLNLGLARYIPLFRGKKKKKEIKQIFKFSAKMTLFTSIFGALLLFFFSELIAINIFHEPRLILFLRAFSIVIPLTVLLEILLSVVLAYEEAGWYSFIHKILTGFLKVTLLLVFVYVGLAVNSIFLSYILSLAAALLITVILIKKKFPEIMSKNNTNDKNKKIFRELLAYSWPLLFYGIIWNVFHWTDSFAIGYFKTATDVGIYNTAVPIAFLLSATTQTFMQLFFPIINKEYARKNNSTVKQLSQQVGKWVFMINLPVLLLFIIFPESFLNLFFGQEYLGASNSLRLLSIGTLFLSVASISNGLIAMKGKSKVVMIDLIVVFLVNLFLNILLIPRYGISGAAFSTMVSLIALSIIFVVQSNSYLSIIPVRRKMFSLTLAAMISLVMLLYLKSLLSTDFISLSILALFFFSSYLLLVFLFKGLDKNDIMVVKSFLSRLNLIKN